MARENWLNDPSTNDKETNIIKLFAHTINGRAIQSAKEAIFANSCSFAFYFILLLKYFVANDLICVIMMFLG